MAAKILVIEDNPTNMELMVYLLAAFGYEAETARNGWEGLKKAVDAPPDLIICDLEMPELNGYQVAQQLKALVDLQNIPLVAVTAYAMVGDREKVLSAGFSGYIPKPISPEFLIQQVESFLPPGKRNNQAPASHPASAREVQSRDSRATVLVVDDSPVNLDLIRSTLEPSGYKVIDAESVEAAMSIVRKVHPALILSDLHMPAETGYEFLRQLRADPRLRSIPFVLFTASTAGSIEGERRRALELGAKRFLSRPIEPEALLAVVESVLQEVSSEPHADRIDC